MPERSFFLKGYQFPLCARCTGVVIGHVLSIIASVFFAVPFWTFLGTIPLMIDGMVQKYTDYESNNTRRVITGILYGFGMMSAFLRFVKKLMRGICAGLKRKE